MIWRRPRLICSHHDFSATASIEAIIFGLLIVDVIPDFSISIDNVNDNVIVLLSPSLHLITQLSETDRYNIVKRNQIYLEEEIRRFACYFEVFIGNKILVTSKIPKSYSRIWISILLQTKFFFFILLHRCGLKNCWSICNHGSILFVYTESLSNLPADAIWYQRIEWHANRGIHCTDNIWPRFVLYSLHSTHIF